MVSDDSWEDVQESAEKVAAPAFQRDEQLLSDVDSCDAEVVPRFLSHTVLKHFYRGLSELRMVVGNRQE